MNTDIFIYVLLVLNILMGIVIFSQPPKQESLATAFNGEKIYKSKIELLLKRITFVFAFAIAVVLIYYKYK